MLHVTQSLVDGQLVYDTIDGTSLLDDHLWIGVEIGGSCRSLHRLINSWVDGLPDRNIDGVIDDSYLTQQFAGPFPMSISVPDAISMPTKPIAVDVPIEDALESGWIDGFDTVADVLAAGEDRVQGRIDVGWTPAEARSVPYTVNTEFRIAGQLVCDLAGAAQPRIKREVIHVPLRIEFAAAPVDLLPQPVGELPAPSGLQSPVEVTAASITTTLDPADPCRLQLSGTINTNGATSVEYRFLNEHGQPSNTFTIDIDDTHVGFFARHVDVPVLDVADAGDDFVPMQATGAIGGKVADVDESLWSGTYSLEIVSPNRHLAADGFNVDYCEPPPGGMRTSQGSPGAAAIASGLLNIDRTAGRS